MSTGSLLGFELLGKLILEELQHIRKDMKEEMQKVGSQFVELCQMHKNILHKIDQKLFLEAMSQKNESKALNDKNANQSTTISPSVAVFQKETPDIDLESVKNKVPVSPNDDELTMKLSIFSNNHNSDSCNVSNMFENKGVFVKEEVTDFKDDLESCFDAYSESSDIVSCDTTKSRLPNFSSAISPLPENACLNSNVLNSGKKYSICNPLFKKSETKNTNVTVPKLEEEQSNMEHSDMPSLQGEAFSSATTVSNSSGTDFDENFNFRCQFCWKPFRHFSSYQLHIRTHTGEKPFTCTLCNKNFTQKGNLTKHMLLHENKKPFKCEVCGKGFTQKSSLKSHMFRHAKQDFFQCSMCDKTFKQLTHLVAHEQVHKM